MSRRGLLAASALVLMASGSPLAEEIYFQGQNQLEASYDTESEKKIVEEWLDLEVYGGPLHMGLQWSAFPWPDPTVSDPEVTGFESLTQRFAELEWGRHRLRVGTFTQLFGRGLALRSYENRNLRIDSNLDGAVYEISDLAGWNVILLRGSPDVGPMEHYARSHKGRLSGLDLGRRLGSFSLGASTVSLDTPGAVRHGGFQTFRGGASSSLLQFDYEGGFRYGDGIEGQGHVLETSLYLGPLSLSGGYKHYEQFAGLNQAPVLVHDQRATLLNRHPHQLDMNDEKGYLLDLSANTPLGAFLLSTARTQHLDGGPGENDALESFLEWDRNYSGDFVLSTHSVIVYQRKAQVTPLQTWEYDEYLTFTGDARFGVLGQELMLEWEHQHKDSRLLGEYDDDLLVAEFIHRTGWSLSLLGEFLGWTRAQQITEGQGVDRSRWTGLQLAGPLGDDREVRLFAGGRRAGYLCIGGVCRYEPAFDGVELSFLSRF